MRIVTTFTNPHIRVRYDQPAAFVSSTGGSGKAMPADAFWREMATQRRQHRRLGIPYRITQAIDHDGAQVAPPKASEGSPEAA